MYDLIKKFFVYLLPILRTVLMQTAADELSRAAYPATSRRRYPSYNRYTRYNRIAPAARYEKIPLDDDGMGDDKSRERFHDVIMVAFDLSGPSANLAHEWLHNMMPMPNDAEAEVHLDSWWVANDERFDRSDCDSAVFVSKGNQEAARKLLREHGLVNQ